MPAKSATSKKSTSSKRKPSNTKRTASSKSRKANSPAKSTTASKAGDQEVTIDRRKTDRRQGDSGAGEPTAGKPQLERRKKVQRRRQIDPTTCERDYSVEEVEFMNSMDEYKRKSGRMFPTCSEVLEVIRELGYVKLTPAEMAIIRPGPTSPEEAIDGSGPESAPPVELETEMVEDPHQAI